MQPETPIRQYHLEPFLLGELTGRFEHSCTEFAAFDSHSVEKSEHLTYKQSK